jgi:hypothetical protein
MVGAPAVLAAVVKQTHTPLNRSFDFVMLFAPIALSGGDSEFMTPFFFAGDCWRRFRISGSH